MEMEANRVSNWLFLIVLKPKKVLFNCLIPKIIGVVSQKMAKVKRAESATAEAQQVGAPVVKVDPAAAEMVFQTKTKLHHQKPQIKRIEKGRTIKFKMSNPIVKGVKIMGNQSI